MNIFLIGYFALFMIIFQESEQLENELNTIILVNILALILLNLLILGFNLTIYQQSKRIGTRTIEEHIATQAKDREHCKWKIVFFLSCVWWVCIIIVNFSANALLDASSWLYFLLKDDLGSLCGFDKLYN